MTRPRPRPHASSRRSFAAALAALALAACTVLEPRADPTRFFVLAPRAAAGAALADAGGGAVPAGAGAGVLVGPLRLPDYLLRPEVVRRVGPNQLEPSRVDRWAEPLDKAFLRVLALDLAALLPRGSVIAHPAPSSERPALQVELDAAAFEGDREGRVRLAGFWSLRNLRASDRAVHPFALERRAASPETPDLVEAMSALVAELAAEIARTAGALPR